MKKWSFVIPVAVLATAAFLILAIRGHWTSWQSDAVVQKTDDAYVTANQIPLSTRISGTVKAVDVHDYQGVRAGEPLIVLDDADYQAVVSEAQAAIAAAQAELAANQAAKHAADAQVQSAASGIAQAQAAARAAQDAIAAAQAQADDAASEYRRVHALYANQAATQEQYDHALAARESTQAALQAKQAQAAQAQAAIASGETARAAALEQRAGLNAKDRALEAQIAAKKAQLIVAQVNLSYATISAPASGRIGKLQVHPGQLIGAGVEVVDFVPHDPWVEANYQETQLRRIRVSDRADVHIDAFPGRTFHGHVQEIAPASGAATALLPPDNATGNFTKVVQRIPVKIVLDDLPPGDLLRPGLSAEVAIHTNDVQRAAQTAATSN
ncbi:MULTISPECIES: HlyD family secretion protein [Acidobacterium]|uniref:Transporter, MFP family n=1 Tax=Acidobacterium capsulatum (strain ATCC 51196 / DSM 11244 / BCRC 80197 / JCM 7670 / NBRC 15755 / NCIMB 13165 / 161) TaxID=240015 RepID=C1F5D5_ACIC5|nr:MULTISPECIES: HlyD family secretion protein [Acidobacterium]ACO32922.1 transporter, MFP family [Acidobacterium capsulatum ATCC 51196]HCT60026.1 HlyD family secretion protein [Acidobacterium sp.]